MSRMSFRACGRRGDPGSELVVVLGDSERPSHVSLRDLRDLDGSGALGGGNGALGGGNGGLASCDESGSCDKVGAVFGFGSFGRTLWLRGLNFGGGGGVGSLGGGVGSRGGGVGVGNTGVGSFSRRL